MGFETSYIMRLDGEKSVNVTFWYMCEYFLVLGLFFPFIDFEGYLESLHSVFSSLNIHVDVTMEASFHWNEEAACSTCVFRWLSSIQL